MERIEKIKNMLNSLGYSDETKVRFFLKRFERIDKIHTNVKGKDGEQLQEMFRLFNKRHDLTIVGDTFPSSRGDMKIKDFIKFLDEYDEKFDLNWCEIDFKELIIKPAYI